MKSIITIIFIFLFVFHVKAQQQSSELLTYVINSNILKNYNNVIISDIDSSQVAFVMRIAKLNKNVFQSIDTSRNKIILTNKEKKLIINAFKSTTILQWESKDFADFKVISKIEIKEYIKENKLNGYINVTHPIFFRDGQFALVYFSNFYGDLTRSGGGVNNFTFYKFTNGTWKKWVILIDGIYN